MARMRPPWVHLLVSLEGRGRVWVDGHWEECGPGRAYLSRAGAPHAFRPAGGQRWRIAWGYYVAARPWQERLPKQSTMVVADGHGVAAAIDGLYREVRGSRTADARRLWATLVDLYWRQIVEQRAGRGQLAALWERVDQALQHPWSIATLGREAGFAREQLRRICQVETGCSPMAQVTRLRMRRALTLLQTTPLSVEAVARAVGYENAFAFSTAFRRLAGHPPRTFCTRS